MKCMSLTGRVEYFYARNGAWQVSQGDAEIFYFRNGQKEMHLGRGVKQVVYPDGTCFKIQDGTQTIANVSEISNFLKESTPSIYLGTWSIYLICSLEDWGAAPCSSCCLTHDWLPQRSCKSSSAYFMNWLEGCRPSLHARRNLGMLVFACLLSLCCRT